MAPSCPGPLGKLLPGWGGGKLLFKSASISPSSLPAEQGDGEPRPDAIPFRSRPGNWPSCSCLRPGALDTGPSHCAGEGGEKENSDAHGPLPHPAALSAHPRPPHSHPSRAPEPLRLNFSSTLPGAARKPAPRLEPPQTRGSGAPEGRPVPAWGGEKPLDGAGRDGGRGPSGRGAGGAGGGGRRRGAQGHKVTGGWGGASLRLGRGQSPDRVALQRLSSGTTRVLRRSRGDEGAWRLGAPGGWRQGRGGPELPPGRGPGHVSRGASEQRARGAPGIVGGQARGGESRGARLGPNEGGGWAPCRKGRSRVGSPGRGRSAGPGTPEGRLGGGRTLGAGRAERGCLSGNPAFSSPQSRRRSRWVRPGVTPAPAPPRRGRRGENGSGSSFAS